MQTVTIEKLVFGGYGLARTPEGVVFVNGVAPGETVGIELTGKRGGVPHARALEIITPSPFRRQPPCQLADRCGGCDWQHLSYDTQVAAKQESLRDCLVRIGRLRELPEIGTASAGEFGYRHRAQIKIDAHGRCGFFARFSNGVVPVSSCALLVAPLNTLLHDLSSSRCAAPSGLANLMVFAGDDDAVASSPVLPGRSAPEVLLTVLGKRFMVAADAFFQSNRPLLERLGGWAQSFLEGDFCIDLYGGTGFFSLMLAGRFKQVLLVETVAAQVAQARRNFEANGCCHCTARAGRAEDLAAMVSNTRVDCLVVDPPRPGLSRTVRESLVRTRPQQLLYVSCNPSTLARDLGFLVNRGGYRLEKIALFDLYPNTHHIESLALLRL
ncbi:MAG: class I SAM-dependent RNA methyltransferase [Chitinispirillaceae bacterium]|nr:class I SAM-dependent RNA methyltransferase [Chitinispirillaceae bacterium]